MSSTKHTYLRCFLILVSFVVAVFLFFPSFLSWMERGYSRTPPRNWTPTPQHHSPYEFGRDFPVVEENEAVEYAEEEEQEEQEATGETEKLNSMFSKPPNDAREFVIDRVKFAETIADTERSIKPVIIDDVPHSRLNLDPLKRYVVPGDIPAVRVARVNCAKLVKGDLMEQKRAGYFQELFNYSEIEDGKLLKRAQNCTAFTSDRGYLLKPFSEQEAAFPLAFSILLFHRPEQFERLLRAIYRPQNVYCVHVDKTSSKYIQDTVGAIVNCFENVFLSPEQYDVEWGRYSVLEPELSCMKELLKYKKWKYFINLTGQEFPLKTNWEIVEILKIFNGANNLEGTIKRRNLDRLENRPPPPANITPTKGSVHIVATRKFVHYIIYNETSLRFRDWVKKVSIPDETYFASLNFNPHLKVPGSYLGIPETDTDKNLFITRFKNWGDGPFNWPCGGKRVRMICIFGVRDLPVLSSRPELFANKFHLDYEPLALDCLEELHYNRTRLQVLNSPEIDRNFYGSLDFVRNHV